MALVQPNLSVPHMITDHDPGTSLRLGPLQAFKASCENIKRLT